MIQTQIVGIDDRNNWNDLTSNLCNVVMVRRFPTHLVWLSGLMTGSLVRDP